MTNIVDLRSDTVTLQPKDMIERMFKASVGDQYYGEDSTVNKLQTYVANLFDKEDALFTVSGTMGNMISILSHTNKSEMVVMESKSHSYRSEVSNIAAIGGVLPKLIDGKNGIIDPCDIEKVLIQNGLAFPDISLILLENTHNAAGGICIDPYNMSQYKNIADKNNLKIHVDGARIFNAAVSLEVSVDKLAKDADSLSFCLTKGLCCPFGGLVVGNRQFIKRARKFQQMLGGGLRQIGYMAAAGKYALENMITRLKEDHDNAKILAKELKKLGFDILNKVETNFVNVKLPFQVNNVIRFINEINKDDKIKINNAKDSKLRLVTHYGITQNEIKYFITKTKSIISNLNIKLN